MRRQRMTRKVLKLSSMAERQEHFWAKSVGASSYEAILDGNEAMEPLGISRRMKFF